MNTKPYDILRSYITHWFGYSCPSVPQIISNPVAHEIDAALAQKTLAMMLCMASVVVVFIATVVVMGTSVVVVIMPPVTEI